MRGKNLYATSYGNTMHQNIKQPNKLTAITNKIILILYLTILITLNNAYASSTFTSENWQLIKPGLKYKKFTTNILSLFSSIHVFEINPKKINFSYCPVENLTTVAQSVQKFKALLAFNGGFFSKKFKTLGLRINKYKTISKLKNISWWGVFYISNNQAFIKSTKTFNHKNKIDFAIQAGPRLLINGNIPKLKDGNASRTALAIDNKGHIFLVITEFAQISTTFLADFLKSELNCQNALNLDGGGSTQLYVNQTELKYHVIGLTKLPDPICLFDR